MCMYTCTRNRGSDWLEHNWNLWDFWKPFDKSNTVDLLVISNLLKKETGTMYCDKFNFQRLIFKTLWNHILIVRSIMHSNLYNCCYKKNNDMASIHLFIYYIVDIVWFVQTSINLPTLFLHMDGSQQLGGTHQILTISPYQVLQKHFSRHPTRFVESWPLPDPSIP